MQMMTIVFAVLWGLTLAAAVFFAVRRPKATGFSQEDLDRRLEEVRSEARSRQAEQLALQEKQYKDRLNDCEARLTAKDNELKAHEQAARVSNQEIASLQVTAAQLQETLKSAREQHTLELASAGKQFETELASVRKQFETELASERKQLDAERTNYKKVQDENETRFRDIAQKVIDASQEKMKRGGEESIGKIVAPLLKDIQDFRAKVEKVNVDDAERAAKLTERIEGLVQQTNSVSAKANELAQAIRGEAQVTGSWAEIQLKRILELSGLKETIDYTYQETFASEGSDRKDLRTDVLVKISEKEWLVVDSKNTMEAYVGYVGADEATQEDLRKRIVDSVRKHVDELKSADYQKSIGKAFRYAFMYIPFEEVYLIAMKAEIKVGGDRLALREYARRNNVLFVNATSLLPTLQLVAATWQNQRSDRNAAKIKAECEGLCKKMMKFLESYQEVGKALSKAAKCYGEGLGQLASGKGNILNRFHKLSEMDVPAARELPEEEDYAERGVKEVEVVVPLIEAKGADDVDA